MDFSGHGWVPKTLCQYIKWVLGRSISSSGCILNANGCKWQALGTNTIDDLCCKHNHWIGFQVVTRLSDINCRKHEINTERLGSTSPEALLGSALNSHALEGLRGWSMSYGDCVPTGWTPASAYIPLAALVYMNQSLELKNESRFQRIRIFHASWYFFSLCALFDK